MNVAAVDQNDYLCIQLYLIKMPKPTTTFKKLLYEAVKILSIVTLLILVAIGQTSIIILAKEVDRSFVFVVILTFTLLFTVATLWNVYRLIPRLLMRGKYVSYISILFGIALFCVLIGIMFEWMMYIISGLLT